MEPTTGGSHEHFEQSPQPLFRLTALMRTLEEKFVQQIDRIAFHHNDAENDYRVQEKAIVGPHAGENSF